MAIAVPHIGKDGPTSQIQGSGRTSFPLDTRNQPTTVITITKNIYDTSEIQNTTNNIKENSTFGGQDQTWKSSDNVLEQIGGGVSSIYQGGVEGLGNEASTLYSATQLNAKTQTVNVITLPIPIELNVNYSANWSGHSLSPLEYGLRELIVNKKSIEDVSKLVAQRAFVDLADKAISKGGSKASSSLSKGVGVAMNPYKQLIYEAPGFRTFQFSWTLSPKNAQESDAIRKIIFLLKRHMHPGVFGESAEDSLLFMYPEFCSLQFLTNSETENQYLFKLEECAITGVDVYYDTKFHQGTNAPTAVSITLSLMETRILTQNDFGDDPTTLTY